MKKLFALLLALAMLLSCTAALADAAAPVEAPAVAPESPLAGPLTIYAKTTIDREVLAVDLAALGLDDTTIALVDTFAAVLAESAERLVIADNGMQWDMILKDKDILSIAGKATDQGLSLGSSVIPNYTIDFSAEEVQSFIQSMASMMPEEEAPNFDVNALTETVVTHLNSFIETAANAIETGEPQTGDYVMDGISYNMCVPMDVDVAAISTALNQMVKDLLADPTVAAAIAQYDKSGKVAQSTETMLNPETVPAVHLDMYMTIDEQGNQSGPVDTAFYVVDVNSTEEPLTTGDVLVNGEDVTVNVQFLTAGINMTFTATKVETGNRFSTDIYANDMYIGWSAELGIDQDGTRYNDADIYFLDPEKPLVCVHTTMAHEGELTFDLDGKKSVTLTDLTAKDGKALSSLAMDAMMNGLGGILSAATEAMPDEVGTLLTLFGLNGAAA